MNEIVTRRPHTTGAEGQIITGHVFTKPAFSCTPRAHLSPLVNLRVVDRYIIVTVIKTKKQKKNEIKVFITAIARVN